MDSMKTISQTYASGNSTCAKPAKTIIIYKDVYLENMANSRKDLVGKTQLCITDQKSPSFGI